MSAVASLPAAGAVAIVSALLAWTALALCQALLPRGLLAAQMREQPPGTRPVRQLGGLVLVPLYLAALVLAAARFPELRAMLAVLGASVALLWVVGVADDHNHLPIGLRLAAQFVAALAVAFAVEPGSFMAGGLLPYWLERALVAVALVYFVNMTNFMDGMDLMTVAGLGLPLILSLSLLTAGPLADPLAMATFILAAGLAGFAVLNRPPARLYLGDNGSLPLGLAAGALCADLAFSAGPVAALLPFGYYLADTLSTLAIRILRGENILRSHSSHAYQVARQAGRSPWWVVAHVAALNVVLAGVARAAAGQPAPTAIGLGLAGAAACLAVIVWFRRQRPG